MSDAIQILSETILTERLELRPIGRWAYASALHAADQDDELRAILNHKRKPDRFFKILLKTKRWKAPHRVFHAIHDRESGDFIGTHAVHGTKVNSAFLGVILHNRKWWGQQVVMEARKAIMVAHHDATQIFQYKGEVYSRNFASVLNYKKLGFEKTATLYSCAFDEFNNRPVDYFTFSLRGEKLIDTIARWKADGV